MFNVGWAFMGVNYGEGEHITFTKVKFSVEGLSEWLGISGFRHEIEFESENADWRLYYKQPENITVRLPDDIGLTFAFSPSFATSEPHRFGHFFKYFPGITFVLDIDGIIVL